MQCPACGTVNNHGRIYCGGCARAVGAVCPVCFFVNEASDRYCGGCARGIPAVPIAAAVAAAATAGIPHTAAASAVPAAVFDNLEDLVPGKSAAAGGGSSPRDAADATQCEVDSFFQRLAREGVAEIHPPGAAAPSPGRSRRPPS